MDLSPEIVTWTFFLSGLAFMLAEKVLPSGVWIFLGLGGLSVAALRAAGVLVDPFVALFVWLVLSTVLTVALRPVAMRYFGGEVSIGVINEDAEAIGQHVRVVETIAPDRPGRIRFRGTDWDAKALDDTIPEGHEAKILARDNLTWIVEPVGEDALDAELTQALDDARRTATDRNAPDRNAPDREAETPAARNRSRS
jgi:membrane protein implicated in regulation of membrane protease activity